MKIYLASSWRNIYYPHVLKYLRAEGFEVYDFRHPDGHFSWSEIDPNWTDWTVSQYRRNLNHDLATIGYNRDKAGMDGADTCILLLPCGRSAHTEAGFMKGQGKKVYALIPETIEPELMYKVFDKIFVNSYELIHYLKNEHL